MGIFGFSFKTLGPNLKVLAVPILIIIIIITLFILTLKQFYPNIQSQIQNYQSSKKVESDLSQKLDLLQKVQKDVLQKSDTTVIALPAKNSTLLVLNNLKTLAAEQGLTLILTSNNPSGKGPTEGVEATDIDFEIKTGDISSLLNFMDSIKTFIPTSTLNEAHITTSNDNISLEMTVTVYWAVFPEVLPKFSEPALDLTAEDKQLLNSLSGLRSPTFVNLNPSNPEKRQTPFN